jgi:hypothetical protein
MNRKQSAFLSRALLGTSVIATAQRNRLYSEGSSAEARKEFRTALRRALEKLLPEYRKSVSDARHCANIETLSDGLSATHKKALNGGRFRIGSAQKALNLYLKFMWCLGRIRQPPHCPFDAIVLAEVPGSKTVKWTQLDNIVKYKEIVSNARQQAGKTPLAKWELEIYGKRNSY